MIQHQTLAAPSPGPHLLITGGVHGDEFEPLTAIRRLIQILPPKLRCGRITLAPLVNQPAFDRAHRTADDQLDLARVCPGDPHGSLTQRLAHELSQLIRSADYYLDLHTGGTQFRIAPLAGYVLHSDPTVLAAQRRLAHAFNLPIIWGTNARLEGRSLSVARDARIPALYAEHGGAATCDPTGVDDYVAGCLNVAAHLQLIDHAQPPTRVRYTVEDDRDHSGHLQIQHPSPAAGQFEPAVNLHDIVHAGQTLGLVVDPLGHHPLPVTAAESGLVLLLRSFPRVDRGDTLAVVLPTCEPGTLHIARNGQRTPGNLPCSS